MRLRYYERRVLKAIFKPFLAYLLCVLIVIATVDRVPDPPFLKPHHDKAAKLCFGGHHQPDSDRDPNIRADSSPCAAPDAGFWLERSLRKHT